MKKVILFFLIIVNINSVIAQNTTIAKFKYEEAEQAFVNEDFKNTLVKLDEAEKLFGKVNPPILYLRIMAQNNLLEENPHDDPQLLLELYKNCKFYLKEYANLNAVEDKYREVYQISDYIKIYSYNPDFHKARSLYYGTTDTPQNLSKAYELCLKLIQNGDSHAMNLLGAMYSSGLGVEKDTQKGLDWFQKAADKGNVMGITNLAKDYYDGEYVVQDYNMALKLSQQAANLGYPEALYLVGHIYYFGSGVSVDYNEAFKWFQKAVAKKNARAMNKLGMMYDFGKGVDRNEEMATQWYQKASDLGNSNSMFALGLNYYKGWGGLAKNTKEGLKWLLKAERLGERKSIPYIAEIYNAEKDYKEAYKWYLKAVDNGNSDAMVQIGVLFSSGFISTDMNNESTTSMHSVTSEQKSSKSALIGEVLGGITNFNAPASLETPYPKDFTESMRWFLMAAEKNNSTAMSHIATYYTYGFGVKKDKKLAKEWNNKAMVAEMENKK
ncbi:tetratricopeptide repeat protein [Flavobacteriaceae bacterium LMO-SS05]